MIDLLKKMIGSRETGGRNNSNAVDIKLATCALLLELAHVDGKFNRQERDNITEIFKTKYSLSEDEVNELIKSSEAELENSIDLWKFTNTINQNYSIEEKLKVIELIWEVAYSDGRLEQHEDYLAHKVASLLRLSHKQLIDAKIKILENKQQ